MKKDPQPEDYVFSSSHKDVDNLSDDRGPNAWLSKHMKLAGCFDEYDRELKGATVKGLRAAWANIGNDHPDKKVKEVFST